MWHWFFLSPARLCPSQDVHDGTTRPRSALWGRLLSSAADPRPGWVFWNIKVSISIFYVNLTFCQGNRHRLCNPPTLKCWGSCRSFWDSEAALEVWSCFRGEKKPITLLQQKYLCRPLRNGKIVVSEFSQNNFWKNFIFPKFKFCENLHNRSAIFKYLLQQKHYWWP